jgi:hypothetical protein
MSPGPSTRGRLNEGEETNRYGSASSGHGRGAGPHPLCSGRFARVRMTAMPSRDLVYHPPTMDLACPAQPRSVR